MSNSKPESIQHLLGSSASDLDISLSVMAQKITPEDMLLVIGAAFQQLQTSPGRAGISHRKALTKHARTALKHLETCK